jgi:SAM-dependent methyltransferase
MSTNRRHEHHNAFQRHYFDTVERPRLRVGKTPYILSHIDKLSATANLSAGQKILEIGAGTGKFTLPMLENGLDIVSNDLSPVLLAKLDSSGGKRSICCDVLDLPEHVVGERFDRIIGFFVLHHLINFDNVFQTLAMIAASGGQIAFCEPVAVNPLYYLQILLTPGMSFRGEPSITAMRPTVVLASMRRAGFTDVKASPYGYFPPFLKNHPWGARLEHWLEAQKHLPFPHAFQIFSGRLPS